MPIKPDARDACDDLAQEMAAMMLCERDPPLSEAQIAFCLDLAAAFDGLPVLAG